MTYFYPFKEAAEQTKLAVWNKGAAITNYNQSIWRSDICSRAIKYSHHGKETEYGWEIDHIIPTANGGGDDLSNLQPLYWKHNRQKSDTYPWQCP